MTVIPLERLPRGFRFHPTDEELVNHYLKGKITGQIEPDDDVIPEIDICKCEPWDLPGKSLIKSDDPEWFFFAPKDRKYPNGLRSKRATEAGYWKATGKDRVIRAKSTAAAAAAPAAKKCAVIGMKKTLVFHRGRAPNGVRTTWIMHEYRTTEPQFESGDQGGYILYRLFKKPEENSSNSNTEEIETCVSSPTSNKNSPNDTPQREAYAMEENGIRLDHGSPKSDLQEAESLAAPFGKRRINDLPGCQTNSSVQPDENYFHLSPQEILEAKPGENVLAQLSNPEYHKMELNSFPYISSPMLPYTDHPFFGNTNYELFPMGNVEQDSLNDLLNSMLNAEECPTIATILENDPVDENLLRNSLWDSTSSKNSGSISDLHAHFALSQRSAHAEPFEGSYGSLSVGPAPQLNTENTSSHPFASPVQPSQDLLSSTSGSSKQKDHSDGFEGIKIKPRRHQLLPNSDVRQGDAARRFLLQAAIIPCPTVDSECNHKSKEATRNVLQAVLDNMMETALAESKPFSQGTETNIGSGHTKHPPNPHKLSTQLSTSARGILLRRRCKVKFFSSSICKSETGENCEHPLQAIACSSNVSEVEKILGPAFSNKLII